MPVWRANTGNADAEETSMNMDIKIADTAYMIFDMLYILAIQSYENRINGSHYHPAWINGWECINNLSIILFLIIFGYLIINTRPSFMVPAINSKLKGVSFHRLSAFPDFS